MITDKRLLNTYKYLPSGWWLDVKLYGYTADNTAVYDGYVDNRFTKYEPICQLRIYDTDAVKLLMRLTTWISWCNRCAAEGILIRPNDVLTDYDAQQRLAYRVLMNDVFPQGCYDIMHQVVRSDA